MPPTGEHGLGASRRRRDRTGAGMSWERGSRGMRSLELDAEASCGQSGNWLCHWAPTGALQGPAAWWSSPSLGPAGVLPPLGCCPSDVQPAFKASRSAPWASLVSSRQGTSEWAVRGHSRPCPRQLCSSSCMATGRTLHLGGHFPGRAPLCSSQHLSTPCEHRRCCHGNASQMARRNEGSAHFLPPFLD